MGEEALARKMEDEHEDDVLEVTPPIVRRFAAVVKRAREKKGWSQRNLAEAINLNHEAVRRIELGQMDPRLSVVGRLIMALDLVRPEVILRIVFGQIGANRVQENET